MLSGPDLGAGFLHQLSYDEGGEGTTFTFHAQDGGSDAGGPPKGSLDVFGFAQTRTPCLFGGPRCWHRRFLLPRSEAPRVRQAYNRHRFVLEAMVAQAFEGRPIPFESALAEVVRRLSAASAAGEFDWYIGGSAAASLQGAELVPRDLDLGTTRVGVDRIASALSEYLIEPLAPTDWPGRGIVQAARAFVGTLFDGLRVEWAVPLEPHERGPFEEWSGRPGVARLVPTRVADRPVQLTRPEYALVRAAEKGSTVARAAIGSLLRRTGTDRPLLEALLERSTLSESERGALLRELAR